APGLARSPAPGHSPARLRAEEPEAGIQARGIRALLRHARPHQAGRRQVRADGERAHRAGRAGGRGARIGFERQVSARRLRGSAGRDRCRWRRRRRAAAAVHAGGREGRPQTSASVWERQEIQALPRKILGSRRGTMPVRYTPPSAESLLAVPGVTLGAAAAKITSWDRDDVLLAVCEPGTVAAGVFTQNRFCAAPVTVCRAHLARQHASGGSFRALIVNAGNANAGTGEAGLADAHAECVAVARLLDCAPEDVLPYSTGVILEPLPGDRILGALAAARRAPRADGWVDGANAIMTTDTVPKGASRRVDVDGVAVTVTGIAKGAGMIHPDMATMLSFIATDA